MHNRNSATFDLKSKSHCNQWELIYLRTKLHKTHCQVFATSACSGSTCFNAALLEIKLPCTLENNMPVIGRLAIRSVFSRTDKKISHCSSFQ